MNRYGVLNVRGGDFCILNEEEHLRHVQKKTERTNENKLSLLTVPENLKKIIKGLKLLNLPSINHIYVLKLEDNNIYISSTKNY